MESITLIDRDRTGDIQLGKLQSKYRSTQNQALSAGAEGQKVALAARIEHTIEHKVFPGVRQAWRAGCARFRIA